MSAISVQFDYQLVKYLICTKDEEKLSEYLDTAISSLFYPGTTLEYGFHLEPMSAQKGEWFMEMCFKRVGRFMRFLDEKLPECAPVVDKLGWR